VSIIAANRPQYDGKVLDLTGKSGARAFRNTLATVLISLCFLIALIPLCWILWTVVSKGYHLVLDANWWSQSQRGITSRRAGGGAYHALVGSLIMALICAVIAVPIGILGAVYLI
jgi:phosphate transport system permease protein